MTEGQAKDFVDRLCFSTVVLDHASTHSIHLFRRRSGNQSLILTTTSVSKVFHIGIPLFVSPKIGANNIAWFRQLVVKAIVVRVENKRQESKLQRFC